MINRIITCGQPGADLGAWMAAKDCDVPTGGIMPKGFRTAEGPKPEYKELYGAQAALGEYTFRQALIDNVTWADVILWFGDMEAPMAQIALKTAQRLCKPKQIIHPFDRHDDQPVNQVVVDMLVDWLELYQDNMILFVGGDREDQRPGTTEFVKRHMYEVLSILDCYTDAKET